MHRTLFDEFDIGIVLLHEVTYETEDLFRLWVGPEPAGDLHRRVRRNDGLDSRTAVAADHAVHFHRRHRPDPLHHLEWIFGAQRFEHVIALELLDRETGRLKLGQLALRWLLDVIVETFDLHLAGAGVVHLGDELHQLTDRIARRAAGCAGVLIRVARSPK